METSKNLNSILNTIKALNENEQNALAEQIMNLLTEQQKKGKKSHTSDLLVVNSVDIPNCPHCGAKSSMGWIIKKGKNRGLQRYSCKSCGKYFVPSTNTAFAYTRKEADTWRKFVKLTISGESLKKCSVECSICYQTAFTWRHKILNAFAENQKSTQMNGVVEVDEMLIPISYKGNHIKGSFGDSRTKTPDCINNIPRDAFERGSDNKSLSSKDKACVFCMVEDGNKSFYAAVPGVGFMSKAMLDNTIGKHVNKDSALMLADNYVLTKNYLKNQGYNHKILSSNISSDTHKKPEIQGDLHLQHVNSMHQHLRNFLVKYYGVSSKYLENYVALFVWLKSINTLKQQRNGAEKASIARATTPDCYITRYDIESRPAVPQCA